MVAATSLVVSPLGYMKLQNSPCGLGANNGGAPSRRPANLPPSFMGAFSLSLTLCHGVGPLGVISVFPERAKAKLGPAMA